MKKLVMILLMLVLLAGCSAAEYEQVQDVYIQQPVRLPAQLLVSLPPDAVQMEADDQSVLWLCDGYTAAITTQASGDMTSTLRAVTGHDQTQLEVFSWEKDGLMRTECTWISAGEGGDQVARTIILDDGNYHYSLTLQTDAENAGQLQETWQQMLATVTLDIVP